VFNDLDKFIRERSADSVVDEVDQILASYPYKVTIHFVEDHFGNNREQSLEIPQRISKLKNNTMKWVGAIRLERFYKE